MGSEDTWSEMIEKQKHPSQKCEGETFDVLLVNFIILPKSLINIINADVKVGRSCEAKRVSFPLKSILRPGVCREAEGWVWIKRWVIWRSPLPEWRMHEIMRRSCQDPSDSGEDVWESWVTLRLCSFWLTWQWFRAPFSPPLNLFSSSFLLDLTFVEQILNTSRENIS